MSESTEPTNFDLRAKIDDILDKLSYHDLTRILEIAEILYLEELATQA